MYARKVVVNMNGHQRGAHRAARLNRLLPRPFPGQLSRCPRPNDTMFRLPSSNKNQSVDDVFDVTVLDIWTRETKMNLAMLLLRATVPPSMKVKLPVAASPGQAVHASSAALYARLQEYYIFYGTCCGILRRCVSSARRRRQIPRTDALPYTLSPLKPTSLSSIVDGCETRRSPNCIGIQRNARHLRWAACAQLGKLLIHLRTDPSSMLQPLRR
ncbi:hypothetical protein PENSPDRAFT_734453 [Peniophora sp. CONT]|nr:hypothetical protein PENSPDRAFT_734453 [Peniophora sp. CONT]